MAGDSPLPNIKRHGTYGYNKGCRCFTCRRAKADAQARFRERRDGGATTLTTPTENVRTGDTMELLTRTEVIGFGLLSAEAEAVAHMAIVTARLIDKIEKEGTWHLLNSTTKRYGELMRELRGIVKPTADNEDEDEDEFLRGVGSFGPSGAQP